MSKGAATANLHVNSYNYGTVSLHFTGLPGGVSASLSTKALTSGAVTVKFGAIEDRENADRPSHPVGSERVARPHHHLQPARDAELNRNSIFIPTCPGFILMDPGHFVLRSQMRLAPSAAN